MNEKVSEERTSEIIVEYMASKYRAKLGMNEGKMIDEALTELSEKGKCSRVEAGKILMSGLQKAVKDISETMEKLAKQT
jgi:hypothetical protein